jgi:hypothetical protein
MEKKITNQESLRSEAKEAGTLENDALHPVLSGGAFDGGVKPWLPLTYSKLVRMLRRLLQDGFASFTEA